MKVKIYRWQFANRANNAVGRRMYAFNLESVEQLYGDHELYDDDGGKDYILPEGLEVAESKTGIPAIYDKAGQHYALIAPNDKDNCRPQLVSSEGIITLREAE